MPDSKLLLHAEALRARAHEISAKADTFKDADSQQKMREVAADYERMAQRLEMASEEHKPPAITHQLSGKRILIVEDEPTIAANLAFELAVWGANVIGPVATVKAALDAIVANTVLDGAAVDIKLTGTMSFSVADVLAAIHIPFLFVTGYGQDIPLRHANVCRLEKPVTPTVVCRALEGLMFGASMK